MDMTGWWLSHPSEKYESQLGFLFPNMEACYKPATSVLIAFCCFTLGAVHWDTIAPERKKNGILCVEFMLRI